MDDGVYEAMVVDADEQADGSLTLDLVVTAGPHKGDVVAVTAVGASLEALDALGLPAELTVTDSRPHVVLDR